MQGLTTREAEKRLKEFGYNRLTEEHKVSFLQVSKSEVREPMILLLIVVGIFYSIWGEIQDAITIFAIILILVAVEVYTEYRAKKSIASLSRITEQEALVIRDGNYKRIKASEIVPGDYLVLSVGDRVVADAKITESYGLMADESALTGESVLVEKNAESDDNKTPIIQRNDMIFAGTVIARGRGFAAVTSTGKKTQIGTIAKLVSGAKFTRTPLQLVMRELTHWMVWVAVFFSILIPILGILRGNPVKEMILTGLALSFATIPEELPIVITMVLALGSNSLSRQKALVKTLTASETLGSVNVICTDKTGTLTENKMSVSKIFFDGKLSDFSKKTAAKKALEAAILCSDVLVKGDSFIGDPMQVSLLKAASDARINAEKIRKQYGRITNEFSFDSDRKMMSVAYEKFVFASGAPEMLLKKCTKLEIGGKDKVLNSQEKKEILQLVKEMSQTSLRVIAYAYKKGNFINQKSAESNLTFLALFGIVNPLRKDVKKSVIEAQDAGVRIIMLTGDHVKTAAIIAAEAGIKTSRVMEGSEIDSLSEKELRIALKDVNVFARVSPENKLRIVNSLKSSGSIVAVTGDGINDAPALSNAHIGIAMGETGTDVAREAASMVLTDDNFSTITLAIKEGRKIFDNMKKGIRYYLSCKIALVLIFLLPVLVSLPLPFAPVQVILLELFMDLAASTAFSTEKAENDIMLRKPRNPREKFLNVAMVASILIPAISLFIGVMFAYFFSIYLGESIVRAQTVAFATWILGHVLLAANMRSEREPMIKLGIFSNKILVLWAIGAVIVLLAAVYIPPISSVLKTSFLGQSDWIMIVAASVVMTFWMEIKKVLFRTRLSLSDA